MFLFSGFHRSGDQHWNETRREEARKKNGDRESQRIRIGRNEEADAG